MKTTIAYTIGFVLSIITLSGQVVLQSGLTHRFSAPPGSYDTFPIKLKNIGLKPCGFSIELADLSIECDSGYRYLTPGTTAQSSAQACLLISSLPLEDPQDLKKLQVRMRYALNVLYRNPMVPGVVALHAKTLRMDSIKGVWALRYLNTGNVDRIISSKAHLLNENGQVIYRTESLHSKSFIPNQCRTLEFPSQDLPSGKYQMVVVSHTDLGEKFGLTHSFER